MSINIAKPVIKQIKDSRDALDYFETVLLPAEDEKTQEIIMNFPTVYIHNWQDSGDFEVYVGESNDIFKRTRQHYDAALDKKRWQSKDHLLKYWEILIGSWHKPWNRELESELSRKEKRGIRGLAWAEQPQTIREVGSTFTIQGFDLNYAGVILGPSVKYRDGKIIFDPSASHNDKAIRNRTLSDGTKQKFGQTLIQHEVRVLMTRGVNGMYIYACDPELRQALLEAAK